MNRRIGLLALHGIGDQKPGSVAEPLATLYADSDTKPYKVHNLCWSVSTNGQTLLIAEANWSQNSSPDNLPEIRLATHIFHRMLDSVVEGFRGCFGLAKYVPRSTAPWIWAILTLFYPLILFGPVFLGVEVKKEIHTFLFYFLIVGSLLFLPIFFRFTETLDIKKGILPLRVVISCLLTFLYLVFFSPFSLILIMTSIFIILYIFLPTIVAWPLVQIIRKLSKSGAFGRITLWVHHITWLALIGPVQGLTQVAYSTWNILLYACIGPGSIVSRILIYYSVSFLVWPLAITFSMLWIAGIASPIFISATLFFEGFEFLPSFIWLLPLGIALVVAKFALPLVDLLLDVSRYHLASLEERKKYTKYARDGIMHLRSQGCTEIHILAHSLGTVIVYDWLRSTLDEERKDVLSLITIGSPLNKFWYIDHGYQERIQDIEGSVVAGLTWHNFYAWSDPIASRLRKYGAGIIEHRLRWLGIWGIAHVNYWTNDEVTSTVRKQLAKATNCPPYSADPALR